MQSGSCFNVTFDSNSSKHVYPSNSFSNFRLRLPRTLHLDESWRVGLADVTYTNARYTFDRPQALRVESTDKKLKADVKIAPAVYHTIQELLDVINGAIEMAIETDKAPKFVLQDKRVVVEKGSYTGLGQSVDVVIGKMSATLRAILGTERWGIPQLNARVPIIFVYCSIVQQRVVGDVEAKLLRTLNTGGQSEFSATRSHVFKRIYFCPLDVYDINEIEIQLLDDTGRPPIFKNGTFRLTLQFKRVGNGPVYDARV